MEQLTRRKFVGGAFVAGAVFSGYGVFGAVPSGVRHKTLDEAFEAAGFDPSAAGSAFFAAIADCHVAPDKKSATNLALLRAAVAEVNALRVKPKFFIAIGDLVNRGNPSFGCPLLDPKTLIEDLKLARTEIDKLDPSIERLYTTGNHDHCGMHDPEYKDFRRELGLASLWRRFDFNGVECFLLCGGQNGDLGKEQETWFAAEIAKVPAGREVICFIHQPPGATSTEWRSSLALRRAADAHEGRFTVIAGHVHFHSVKCLVTPKKKSVPVVTVEAFRQKNTVTWWAYGVRDGKLAASVKREGDGTFVVYDLASSRRMPWQGPFEDVPGVSDRVFADDPRWHETFRQSQFTKKPNILMSLGYYYMYMKGLEGWIDLKQIKGPRSRLYVLMTCYRFQNMPEKNGEIKLSYDGVNYETVEFEQFNNVWTTNIRSDAERLYAKVWCKDVNTAFCGFAFG